jgi:HEAT repeat protein
MTSTYTEPVTKLLKLGRPAAGPWLDYSTLGITREHIPELILLVEDNDLLRKMERPDDLPEDEDLPEWYAQIHAWRALAQLKTEEAIPVILGILYQFDDEENDWIDGDAGEIFALIGPAAIRPLTEYLADDTRGLYSRATAATSLQSIGTTYPETRDECIQSLVSVLESYEENEEELNSFLVNNLVELNAVEAIELIEKAFEENCVDEFIMGDLEDVQIELGLLEARTKPRGNRISFMDRLSHTEEPLVEMGDPMLLGPERKPQKDKTKEREKNKRKQEKKSRKKNRKKK